MKSAIKILAFMLLLAIVNAGCKKGVDNPNNDADHAAITTLILQFRQGGVLKSEVTFDDPDGVGGANPIKFDTIKLNKGEVYDVNVILQNKSTGTTQDATATIKAAGHQHEFFYILNSNLAVTNFTIQKLDTDRLGFPLGFDTRWSTPNTAVTGSIRVTLRHMAFGKTANNSPTDGHADIEINFATIVQ